MIRAVKKFLSPLLTQLNIFSVLLCSLLAAAAGPFGTYESQTYSTRLVFWFLVCVTSVFFGHACRHLAQRIVPPHRPVWTDILITGLMMVTFTPVLWVLTHDLLTYALGAEPSMMKLSYYVFAVTVGICVARRILPGFEPVGYFGPRKPEPIEDPRLVRRLSSNFNSPILHLTVRDHFVDVVTASGKETIRMRFADAIEEMDTVVGYCTHRSHWVARNAIAGVERESGKIFVRLTNGDLVPVSRKYRPNLEDAGIV